MPKTIVQIYEIQTPEEARSMIALGVDHIGSVLRDRKNRLDPAVRETLSVVKQFGAVSSLIPLFNDSDAVFECIGYHKPDIIHFCDALHHADGASLTRAIALQQAVKERFAQIRIMRSIPIPSVLSTNGDDIHQLAARFEPVTDLFLTDTVLIDDGCQKETEQPVDGFVGITGKTCDWQVASELVASSSIPVILAGGISPENVKRGILQVRPFGIDSCTRTNACDDNGQPIRFVKDVDKVKALIEQTRLADQAIEQNE